MAQFEIIKNPQLQLLVSQSRSINSLDEKAKAQMIERISKLPEAGQQLLLQNLQDEALGSLSLEEKNAAVQEIKKNLDKTVMAENEKADAADSNQEAKNLLKKLFS